jgi:hypothetical protein
MNVRGRLADYRQDKVMANFRKKHCIESNDVKRDRRSCYGESTTVVRVPSSIICVLETFLMNYTNSTKQDRRRYCTVLMIASDYVRSIRLSDEAYDRENERIMNRKLRSRKNCKTEGGIKCKK